MAISRREFLIAVATLTADKLTPQITPPPQGPEPDQKLSPTLAGVEFTKKGEIPFETAQEFYFAIDEAVDRMPPYTFTLNKKQLMWWTGWAMATYKNLQVTRNSRLPESVDYANLPGDILGLTNCKEDWVRISSTFNLSSSDLYGSAMQLDTLFHEIGHGGAKLCRAYRVGGLTSDERRKEEARIETSAEVFAKACSSATALYSQSKEAFYAFMLGMHEEAFGAYLYQAVQNAKDFSYFAKNIRARLKTDEQKEGFSSLIEQISTDISENLIFSYYAYDYSPLVIINDALFRDNQALLLKPKGIPGEFEEGYLNIGCAVNILNSLDWYIGEGLNQFHEITPSL